MNPIDRCPTCAQSPCGCPRAPATAPTRAPEFLPTSPPPAEAPPPPSFRAPRSVLVTWRLAMLLCEEAIGYDDARKAWVCPECEGEGRHRAAIEHRPGCDLKAFYTKVRAIDDKIKANRSRLEQVHAASVVTPAEQLPEGWVWDDTPRCCRALRLDPSAPEHVQVSRRGKLESYGGNVPVRVFASVRARAKRLGYGPPQPEAR